MAAPLVALVVLVVVLLVGCGGDAKNDRAKRPPKITFEGIGSGELIDIGGRRLYMECIGSGKPTVLLEAGFGGGASLWADMLPELGQETRTCAYDRAGIDASDAIPGVHDAGDEIRDLERLLDRGRIDPPYVVVGHSYGGLLARLFAHGHRDETAGVVLVDAVGRDQVRRQLAIWPKSQASALRRDWAEPVQDGVDLRAGDALDKAVRTLGETPLVVITAGRADRGDFADLPARLLTAQLRLWRAMHAELARLSSDHVHVVASRSDHFIYRDQPLVVMRAVRAVVHAVRDEAPLPACERVFTGPAVRCLS